MFQALMTVCCAYALWRGGRDERMAAVGYAVAAILSALVLRPHSVILFKSGLLSIDLLLYVVFAHIALRSTRYWPLWLTWFQGADVICQLAMLYYPALSSGIYRNLVGLWAYPILLLIASAAWRHRRELPF